MSFRPVWPTQYVRRQPAQHTVCDPVSNMKTGRRTHLPSHTVVAPGPCPHLSAVARGRTSCPAPKPVTPARSKPLRATRGGHASALRPRQPRRRPGLNHAGVGAGGTGSRATAQARAAADGGHLGTVHLPRGTGAASGPRAAPSPLGPRPRPAFSHAPRADGSAESAGGLRPTRPSARFPRAPLPLHLEAAPGTRAGHWLRTCAGGLRLVPAGSGRVPLRRRGALGIM